VQAVGSVAPEWVTYQNYKAHPVLSWLPTCHQSLLFPALAENMQAELAIPAKQCNCFTVAELNSCAKQEWPLKWETSEDMDDSSMGM
jgi:hypothetical protein